MKTPTVYIDHWCGQPNCLKGHGRVPRDKISLSRLDPGERGYDKEGNLVVRMALDFGDEEDFDAI